MSRNKKLLLGLGLVVVLGGIAYANFGVKRSTAVTVTTEKIERRDLESIVSASGKIQPKRQVNVSAETMGKVVAVMVNEGDLVKAGQPLVQIDPKNLETQVQNREASLASARSRLEQTKAQVETARVALAQSQANLRRAEAQDKSGLIPKEQLERLQNDVKNQTTNLKVSEQSIETQEQIIKQEIANLETARYDLKKGLLISSIDGVVTKRNIEVGETAVVGTMNNAGTVLLTVADLSVLETEIEVDETDIPRIALGQPAKITIDAIPDKTFPGRVTEVANSPIQTGTAAAGRATTFKVTVTIEGSVPNVRPGFTCTAVVTTATRTKAIAVPIQAMTMRDFPIDDKGNMVRAAPKTGADGTSSSATPAAATPATGATAPAGSTPKTGAPSSSNRKDFEGVFLVKAGRAVFTPVKTGIDGEKYFEALEGLADGDEVITGPFASVRNLKDGDEVKVGPAPGGGAMVTVGG